MNSPAADPISIALAEDLGETGDISSTHFIPDGSISSASLVAREECVLAGIETAAEVFRRFACGMSTFHCEPPRMTGQTPGPSPVLPPSLNIEIVRHDGNQLRPGAVALHVSGPSRSLLSAERTALNFVQQLSGVATLTAKFVRLLEGTRARLLDTRKTIPGLRALQKQAVLAGGGHNHRMGLHDMVMLKDNHLAALGTRAALAQTIAAFRHSNPGIRVEIEADSVSHALEFFEIPGVDVVLLDNMPAKDIEICVRNRPEGIELEASGGIHLGNLREIAMTGVDWISVGAITHSAPAIDFGLDFD